MRAIPTTGRAKETWTTQQETTFSNSPMPTTKPVSAPRRSPRHLLLPRTSLDNQIDAAGYEIESEADGIRFDVSELERGLYYLSIEHDSDYPLAGPRVTVARPAFETSDHIYTFVRRDQREFFGTILIVNEIEALVFYPSKLPCHVDVQSITLRRINT